MPNPFSYFKIATYQGLIHTVREIKIRCSELKDIVSGPYKAVKEPLTEKQRLDYDKWLSEGKTNLKKFKELQAKLDKANDIVISSAVLHNFYDKYILGFDSFFGNKATVRGTDQEQDSIDLFNSVYKTNYKKNTIRKTNDYLTGEPDMVSEAIGDIKTRQDWKTFSCRTEQEDIDDHMWQLWGYGQLFDKSEGVVINTLPSYPVDFIQNEQARYYDDKRRQDQIFHWYNYDRINPKDRVKMTRIDLTTIDSELVYRILDKFYFELNKLTEYKPKLKT